MNTLVIHPPTFAIHDKRWRVDYEGVIHEDPYRIDALLATQAA